MQDVYILFLSLVMLNSSMDVEKLKWRCLTILDMPALTILNAYLWRLVFKKKKNFQL